MRTATRWAGAFGAVVCVVAAVVMCVAAFLPYTGGNWGDGLQTNGQGASQVTISIISGSDAWFVLATVITLALVAAAHLVGVRRHATGAIALAASLVTLGLALKLPGTWMQDGVVYGEPYLLYVGYYVFLRGALAAVAGALLMTLAGLDESARSGRNTLGAGTFISNPSAVANAARSGNDERGNAGGDPVPAKYDENRDAEG